MYVKLKKLVVLVREYNVLYMTCPKNIMYWRLQKSSLWGQKHRDVKHK